MVQMQQVTLIALGQHDFLSSTYSTFPGFPSIHQEGRGHS